MHIVDIGGGFTSGPKFAEAASAVKVALQKYFPNGHASGLKIMAEPGRFIANEPFTLATSILGKRIRNEIKEYWINDGMSGSMNYLKYDHDDVTCTPLANYGSNDVMTSDSTVFGPTCDPEDTVLEGYPLPDLQVNDWLVFHNLGAYTSSRGNDFNGFKTSAIPTYLANFATTPITCKGLKTYNSTVFGPTCEPADTVFEGYPLPDLQVNDWLVFHDMGAYTSCRANDFNGFKTSDIPTYLANSDKS
ncbi:Orn/DAP/Arg decarboxylase 2 [Theobroma cacao]|nr:Orn/DAP/Arg decarboxylase 2 [Theobroma cacao]